MSEVGCFIGDSHAVAVKLAWDEMRSEHPDCTIDMFASPNKTLSRTEYCDGSIVPTNGKVARSFVMTASRKHIVLRDYDFFCVIACGFDVSTIVDRLADHGMLGWKIAGAHLVSYDCFKAAIVDVLKESLAAKFYTMIRKASSAPVYFFPQPYRSEAILAKSHPLGKFDLMKAVIEKGDGQRVHDLFVDACSKFSAETGVHVVRQPEYTRAQSILTKVSYSMNAVRLQPGFNTPRNANDCTHMNKVYGSAVLKEFLAMLG